MAHSEEESSSLIWVLPRSDNTRQCGDNTRCIFRVGSFGGLRRLSPCHRLQHPSVGALSHSWREEPLYKVSGPQEQGDCSEGKREAHGQKIKGGRRTEFSEGMHIRQAPGHQRGLH